MLGIHAFLPRTRIAYFTMEIGLRPEIHTYSGGLGILAGDTARSAADLELPMVFVSIVCREGYLRQEIDPEGRQIDHPDPWDPAEHTQPLGGMVAVQIEGRPVWIQPWLYELSSPLGFRIPVIFLDTHVEQNDPRDRGITDRLYAGDETHRLKQEIVLGIGGERILRALGFTIETFHLNEGHAALLAVSLLRRYRRQHQDPSYPVLYDIDRVRQHCVFTTHTPVEAGHDRFAYEDVQRILGDFIELDELKRLGGADRLNMTRLALNLSAYVNGVAQRHAETTRRLFPGYRIRDITNGAHVPSWIHPTFARLFDTVAPQWGLEPGVLVRSDQLADESVWGAHEDAKADLLGEIFQKTGVSMRRDMPLLGFARRMTGYKRPDLLFTDLERLRAINAHYPFQLVMAGKAHPRDEQGKTLIREIHGHMRRLGNEIPMAFLPNYDMTLGRKIVSGTDIWLNTPLPPLEASGTSGMKASMNGVLNLSVLDGWWLEGCIEGVTGWAIGEDHAGAVDGAHAGQLYDKLENTVLPLYYRNRERWIWMMKQAISKIGTAFNSQRMMRRYAAEAYLR